MELWLDADDTTSLELGDGGGVEAWHDRSGRGWVVIATHPTFAPDASIKVEKGIAHGHAALRLGGQLGMFEHKNIYGPTLLGAPFILAIVAAYDNPTSRPALFFRQEDMLVSPSHPLSLYGNDPYGSSSNVVGVFCGNLQPPVASAMTGWNDGRFHTFGMIIHYTNGWLEPWLHLRVDGAEIVKPATSPCSGQGNRIAIGGDYLHNDDAGVDAIESALDGYLAEVIVVSHNAGTPTQLAQLSAYFQKKYGIPF